jgi:DHA3 family macrolide efflux protein-like MFS transporter
VSAIRLRRGLWVWSGMVGMGVAFLAMGILLWLPLTLAGLAAVGLALNVSNISLITIYQQLIPDELRGKVFGLLVALSLSLQPIAYGVMGGLIELFSPQAILLASGLVIIASGLTLVRVPELRAL